MPLTRLAHARALLVSDEAGAAGYIHADVRDTGAVLAQAEELLDFTRPVAVRLLAVLCSAACRCAWNRPGRSIRPLGA
jgi:hypothetical protein